MQSVPMLLRALLRHQLHHPWQAALALTGIVMGVAIVTAVDLANSAARAAFQLSAEQLRGEATHRVVAGDGSVPNAVYARLFTSANAPAMAPVVTTRVRVTDQQERYQLIGLDVFNEFPFRDTLPSLLGDSGSLADWLAGEGQVALSRSAAEGLAVDIGDRVQISARGKPHVLEVFAVYDDNGESTRHLLIVDIATAQVVSGELDGISHVDLKLDAPRAAALAAQLPDGLQLLSIAEQTADTVGLSAAFELNLTAMGLLALLVGMFLIYNAASFSVVQRRNLFGRLRAIGVRDAELTQTVMAEAAVLAVVGTLIGLVIGTWLGQGLTSIVAGTIDDLYYRTTTEAFAFSVLSVLKAAVLGIGGTLAAFWLPARAAAATPPLTTLSREALERTSRQHIVRAAVIGSLLIASGYVVSHYAPGGMVSGFAGLFLMLVGAAMVTPVALRLLHGLLSRLPLSGIWRMAVRDLDRHLSRLATATAALMVALAASVGVAIMVDSMRLAVGDWLRALLVADVYVAHERFGEEATLPAGVIARVTGRDDVAAFGLYRDRDLTVAARPVELVAAKLPTASREGFELIDATRSPWQAFDSGAILISEPLAYRLGLEAGDSLPLSTPAGKRSFEIAAVFRDFASEHGRVFMSHGHYVSHWQDTAIETVALFATGPPEELWTAIERDLEDELIATQPKLIFDESMAVFDKTFRITEVLRTLSLAVAVIGIFSALMAVQLERRKEHAVLRALGLTRGAIAALILVESAVIGLLAGLMSLPTGIVMADILTQVIQRRAFGWSMPLHVEVDPMLVTVAAGLVASLVAAGYPAWKAAHGHPAGRLRED